MAARLVDLPFILLDLIFSLTAPVLATILILTRAAQLMVEQFLSGEALHWLLPIVHFPGIPVPQVEKEGQSQSILAFLALAQHLL